MQNPAEAEFFFLDVKISLNDAIGVKSRRWSTKKSRTFARTRTAGAPRVRLLRLQTRTSILVSRRLPAPNMLAQQRCLLVALKMRPYAPRCEVPDAEATIGFERNETNESTLD